MKKLLKFLFSFFLVFVLLLVAAVVVLRIYFPPERIKKIALEFISAKLHREVKLDAVSINIKGIKLNGLAVSELADFSKGEMFKAGEIAVGIRWKPLLKKQVQIGSLAFSDMSLNVIKRGENEFNFSDLLDGQKPAKPAQAKTPIQMSVDSISLKNCALSYKDLPGKTSAQVSKFSFKAKSPSADKPFDFSLSGAADYKSAKLSAKIPFSGDFNLNLPKETFKIKKLELSQGKVSALISGEVTGFKEPQVSLNLATQPFNTDDISQFAPGLPKHFAVPQLKLDSKFKMLPDGINIARANVSAGPAEMSVSGRASWEKTVDYLLKVKASMALPEIKSDALQQFSKDVPKGYVLPASEIKADATISTYKADIHSLMVKAGAIVLNAQGSVIQVKQGWNVLAALKTNDVALAEVSKIAPAMLKTYALGGTADADVKLNFSGGKLAFNGTANLNKVQANYALYAVSELTGAVQFTENSAKSQKLTGKLLGGTFTSSFDAAMPAPKKIKAAFDIGFDTLNLAAIPVSKEKSDFGNMDIKGKIKIAKIVHPNFSGNNAEVSMDLTNITPKLDGISGKSSFAIKGGRFSDLSVFGQYSKWAKMLLAPITLLQKAGRLVKLKVLPNFDDVSYSLIEGQYEFQNGLMKIIKSNMDSSAGYVSATGSANFATDAVDIKVNLKNTGNINIKGTMSDPSVKVDLKSVLEQQPQVKKATEKIKQEASSKLKEEGAKALKKLFK
ncbi:MAG: AsmA family protein [Elusimicrobia bacterium]|nr:AsmA family protein [Elusimicrobiota bacterium]